MTQVATRRHEAVAVRTWLVPLLATAACLATSVYLQWSWRDQLPARIATHFGADGRPDGWSSLNGNITFTVVFGTLMTIFMLGTGLLVHQGRQMGGVAAGTGAFIAALGAGMVSTQRGATAQTEPQVGPMLFTALGLALAVGLLVWLAIRRRGPEPVAHTAPPTTAPTIAGAQTARLSWIRPLRRSRGALVASVLLGAVVPIMALCIAAAGDWWMAAVLLLIGLVAFVPIGMMWAVVTIDHRGVQARALGIRWMNIPLETVTSAETVKLVSPLGDFGGWGVRGGFSGDRGLVTSEGPGLRIHRAEQSDWVITVDDAERAAAVVNTLVARAQR